MQHPMLQSSCPTALAALYALFAIAYPVSATASNTCSSGCSGHGDCGLGGSCVCKSPWAGLDCSFFLSISSDTEQGQLSASRSSTCIGGCSGQGRCVSGTCLCHAGYYGPTCADAQCPDNCFGHGTCSQGTCLCSSGWLGQKCEMSVSQDQQKISFATVPARGGTEAVDDLMRDLYAGDNSLSSKSASPASPRTEPEQRMPDRSQSLLEYQKASRASEAVWEVADQLYAAAARENKNDASRRIKRAIAGARQNFDQLPGHEFGSRAAASSGTAFLAQRTNLKPTLCRAGCGNHGSCNAGTGQCHCADSWTGASCDVKRCPDDCSGSGMCIAGSCVCDPQRFGHNCQHERCPDDCSGHGYCFSGSCQCSGNFGGENCLSLVHSSKVVRMKLAKKPLLLSGNPKELSSLRASSDESLLSKRNRALSQLQAASSLEHQEQVQCSMGCNNRGSCIKGSCLCYSGYQGSDCSIVGACSAHGTPKKSLLQSEERQELWQTACSCDPGWSGLECNVELVCPDQSCAGHGICNYGKCTCAAGYSGHSCHISQISLLQCRDNCNGHGECVSGACSCHTPYDGNACEILSNFVEGTSTAFQPTVVQPDIVSTLSVSLKTNETNKEDTGDAADSPMTVSWLEPAKLVQPSADKFAELLKRSSETSASAIAAISADDMPWHPAVAPQDAAATHGEGSSIFALSSSKVDGNGKALWAERPLENTAPVRNQQSSLRRNLVSLLSRTSATKHARSSDIDSLLGDISD